MTFKQAKRLVLRLMKQQGIKLSHIPNHEVEKAAIAVLHQAETEA